MQLQLSSSEASMLLMLEDELSVEEILLYRDIVKRHVKSDGGGLILQGSNNIGVGSKMKSSSSSGGWWFQRYDKGQPQVKELSEWTGISQNEAELVLEELFQMGDKMPDTDIATVNEPVFCFSIEVRVVVVDIDVHIVYNVFSL